MFPIDFDPAAEARELALSRAEELMHTKPDRGARRIELVALGRCCGGTYDYDYGCGEKLLYCHRFLSANGALSF
jgi:hypothetical protein